MLAVIKVLKGRGLRIPLGYLKTFQRITEPIKFSVLLRQRVNEGKILKLHVGFRI